MVRCPGYHILQTTLVLGDCTCVRSHPCACRCDTKRRLGGNGDQGLHCLCGPDEEAPDDILVSMGHATYIDVISQCLLFLDESLVVFG